MNKENLNIQRHSLAHLMAMSIQKLWPAARFGVGPTIDNGFYYDIEIPHYNLMEEDLGKIEKTMKELEKEKLEYERKEISIDEGIKLFQKLNQPYKVELLNDLETKGTTKLNENEAEVLPAGSSKISVYQTGGFIDLCRGPHLKNTKEIKLAFKLTHLAGAYWRGDEKNPMLTRIYGLAFATQKELDEYLVMLEEAKKRDHRQLGQDLDLFMFDEEVGQGLPLWLPKGAILRKEIEDFALNEYLKRGYQLVRTPHIGSEKLFNISGHLDFYKDSMYSPMKIDEEPYYLKPMNCPMHVKIYKRTLHSYRDLPIRYTELGTVYRYERSGTLHGLTRVRGFTQDDAHIICAPKQLLDELVKVLELKNFILKTFGFENFKVSLSVRDPKNKAKYLGTDKEWAMAEKSLAQALNKIGWSFKIDEGEAIFYGPKIDIKVTDAIKREWQISTLQVDFNLPEKFNMTYIDDKGDKKRPFMLHRALLGSLERFTGVLIEHYEGAFPLWLSPVQIKIISVGSAHEDFCLKLAEKFQQENIRTETDLANETVGNKIRKAANEKIPYILVIGDKEMKSDKSRTSLARNKLAIRVRGQEKLVEMVMDKFILKVKKIIAEKSLEL